LIQTSNLIQPNLITKLKETLLETTVIADQNGGKSGKRQIEETDELSFLAYAIKEGRRSPRRVQMQLAQPETICEFGLPSVIAYSQINITVPHPVRSSTVSPRFIYLVVFPQKHYLQYATELPAF